MAYEAIIYNQEGKPRGDVRAIFDRSWLLNGYEQCTFTISAKAELARLDDFDFGHYLVITDDEMAIWGGYFDPNQTWSTSRHVTIQAYSAEKLFMRRCFPGQKLLTGSPGSIYRQIVEATNSVLPWSTLIRPGEIYEGGQSRQETITAKKLYDDVVRISSRGKNDWYVEPIVEDGELHFEAHWYDRRGEVKNFALEEGINVEASANVLDYQGDIWNYIFAYGKGATWKDRVTVSVYDQESIDQYDVRMYPLAVDATEEATVRASAEAFLASSAWPKRVFNLVVGGKRVREDAKSTLYKTLRIGDIVDLRMYSVGQAGIDTQVRVTGMTHRGKQKSMALVVKEVQR